MTFYLWIDVDKHNLLQEEEEVKKKRRMVLAPKTPFNRDQGSQYHTDGHFGLVKKRNVSLSIHTSVPF